MQRRDALSRRHDVECPWPQVWPSSFRFELISVVTALREIKHYQQHVVEETFIPPRAFQKLIQQICDKNNPEMKLRCEKDAIFTLQAVTEDVLTMLFEMTYSLFAKPTNREQPFGDPRQTIDNHGPRYAVAP